MDELKTLIKVEAPTLTELVEKVNEKIKEGYRPCGWIIDKRDNKKVSFIRGFDSSAVVITEYCQPMTKPCFK